LGVTLEAINMTEVIVLPNTSWDQPVTTAEQKLATNALEQGSVLLFPHLNFSILDGEEQFLSPAVVGKAKNVSLDPATGSVRGGGVSVTDQQRLQNMLDRFAASSKELLSNVLPHYESGIEQARTSFRPVEIAGRQTSWRKDDTRLHVDSFPSSPTQGNRILRVFSNVNPHGQTRNWRLGESFEDVAQRYLPSIPSPIWGSDHVLNLFGVTKRRRTAYDHYMLQLHDRMKADVAYQSQVAQRAHEFQPGSTWMVFTDSVSHAVIEWAILTGANLLSAS
jgi:hypothetical protein